MKDLVSRVKEIYHKSSDFVKFNRRLVVSELSTLVTGPVSAQATDLFTNNDLIISAGSNIGDSFGYWTIYRFMLYHDNKDEYRGNRKQIYRDLRRFGLFSSGPAVIYGCMRYLGTNYLLRKGYQPYEASLLAKIPSMFVYFVMINALYKMGLIAKK
ncbi:MAG: hypothetical protein V1663_04600 [archaeon]